MVDFKPLNDVDLDQALKIYNYYVENSTATFHTAKITKEELATSLSLGSEKYPSFGIYHNNNFCGFCYISKFRPKQAYDISAEVTLYLDKNYTQKGIGKQVLEFLEIEAKKRGINNLLGVITEENSASIKLFESNGYHKAALLKNIGIKFGRALDVSWYQKEL